MHLGWNHAKTKLMHSDIVDLREFYLNPLGRTVRRLLRAHVARIWPSVGRENILVYGYGTPLLRPFLGKTARLLAMMPAGQGATYWPREGPNITCLVDGISLPLPDQSVDRVIVMHGLEAVPDADIFLREIWRVMKSGARLLVIVPNRRGLWAHSDRTPFGDGQPYSSSQLKRVLRDQGFLVDRAWTALFLPPSTSRLVRSIAGFLEKYGDRLFPALGGVHVMEASKQLYAPLLTKSQRLNRRLVLPLPLPMPHPSMRQGL